MVRVSSEQSILSIVREQNAPVNATDSSSSEKLIYNTLKRRKNSCFVKVASRFFVDNLVRDLMHWMERCIITRYTEDNHVERHKDHHHPPHPPPPPRPPLFFFFFLVGGGG